ncbi:flagellar hook-basal body protein [uncultured Desulfobacter sp.]|uniref:flagellar hook-basal body protein n=1 Tax=uncultured Desulfobacter sp. TaxID=240139 RepID=UPI002AAC3F0F|nr:flagellar hook-basal body protein [uncultured Desulfobacter sp.]
MILEMTRPTQGGLRQERKLEAVSNNLANASTIGFKKDVVSFDKAFRARVDQDFTQGDVIKTDNPLDVALGPQGLFKVETPDGIRYTRNGNFSLSGEGILVDKSGNPVMGQGGAIFMDTMDPNTSVNIDEYGQIFLDNQILDTLDVVSFEDMKKLEKTGDNLFVYTGDSTDEIALENVRVKAGSLEQANVRVVEEMAKMIEYQRMFETYAKSMKTFDEIDSKAINEVGMV